MSLGRCIDGLLWLGQSYSRFSCKAKKTCAIPLRQHPPHCFLHEAERRGVSRKVSQVPAWAVAGKTRIFLAHRGGLGAKHKGRLFGYFVLHRIEILSRSQNLAPPPVTVLTARILKGRGLLEGFIYDYHTGKPVAGANISAVGVGSPRKAKADAQGYYRVALSPGTYSVNVSTAKATPVSVQGLHVAEGKKRKQDIFTKGRIRETERRQKCWDGSEIVTHRFINGRWRRTNEECPELDEPPECSDGDVRFGFCDDGSLITTQVCLDGEWQDTGAECPQELSIDNEMFSEHRSCSLRLKPRGVYLVDCLNAEIVEKFGLDPELKIIQERYRRAASDLEKEKAIHDGRKLFNSVVDRILDRRKSRVKVPARLKGKAYVCGELVLFKEPPFLERHPSPAFRSLAHIDGDHVLEQIGKTSSVQIRFCPRLKTMPKTRTATRRSNSLTMTKRDIVCRLAEQEKIPLAVANRFFDQLYGIARTELKTKGVFRLPHFGTLRLKKKGMQFDLATALKKMKNPRVAAATY